MSSSSSSSSTAVAADVDPSSTAAKISALSRIHPAHPTSLGMQVLAEDKLRMRMRVQQKDDKEGTKSHPTVVVNALGWILNEWLLLLESRRANGAKSPSPAFIQRLREIAHTLLSDPRVSREPIEAASVFDADTAIPESDLNAIIARIPKPVAPDSGDINPESYDDAEDDTLTAAQRSEEQQAMDTIRRKYEADAVQGIVHPNILTDDLLAAIDQMPAP